MYRHVPPGTENPCVPGSIPGPGTNNLTHLAILAEWVFLFGYMPVTWDSSRSIHVDTNKQGGGLFL
jgi:hypothetical protein